MSQILPKSSVIQTCRVQSLPENSTHGPLESVKTKQSSVLFIVKSLLECDRSQSRINDATLNMISYNSLLLCARNSEALMVSERERVCWTLQKFFNNEKTRSAAAEEGWTRTTKAAASHL
jgi:hypothetical protein